MIDAGYSANIIMDLVNMYSKPLLAQMRILFSLVVLLFAFQQASACTCIPAPRVKQNWQQASQVFIGQVESIDSSGNYFSQRGDAEILVTIRILESFKGEYSKGNAKRTFINSDGSDCKSYFEKGEIYLIYAFQQSDLAPLQSSSCLRTNRLKLIKESELDELRKLHIEEIALYDRFKNTSEYAVYHQLDDKDQEISFLKAAQEQSNKEFTLIVVGCLVVILSLVILLVFLWRKSKRYVRGITN